MRGWVSRGYTWGEKEADCGLPLGHMVWNIDAADLRCVAFRASIDSAEAIHGVGVWEAKHRQSAA